MRFLSTLFGLYPQAHPTRPASSAFNQFPPEILENILLHIAARHDFISFALTSRLSANVATNPYMRERWFKAHYDDASTSGCEYSLTDAEMVTLGYSFEHFIRICLWIDAKYDWVDQDSLSDDLCQVLMGCWGGGVGYLHDLSRMPRPVADKVVALAMLAPSYRHETVLTGSGLSELVVPGEASVVFCHKCKNPTGYHTILLGARVDPTVAVEMDAGGKENRRLRYRARTVFPYLRPYNNSTDVFFALDPEYRVVTGRSVYKIIVPQPPTISLAIPSSDFQISVSDLTPFSLSSPPWSPPAPLLSHASFRDIFHYTEYTSLAHPLDAMIGDFSECHLLRDVDPAHGLREGAVYGWVETRCDSKEGWIVFFEGAGSRRSRRYELRCCGVRWEAGVDRERWGLID